MSWQDILKVEVCGASRLNWRGLGKTVMWLCGDKIKDSWSWRPWLPSPTSHCSQMFITTAHRTAAASTSPTSTSSCLCATPWPSCSASSWTPPSSFGPTGAGAAVSGTLRWSTWSIWPPRIWCIASRCRSSWPAMWCVTIGFLETSCAGWCVSCFTSTCTAASSSSPVYPSIATWESVIRSETLLWRASGRLGAFAQLFGS